LFYLFIKKTCNINIIFRKHKKNAFFLNQFIQIQRYLTIFNKKNKSPLPTGAPPPTRVLSPLPALLPLLDGGSSPWSLKRGMLNTKAPTLRKSYIKIFSYWLIFIVSKLFPIYYLSVIC